MRQETGWVGRLFDPQSYTPEYQELKFALHRKLLDRINLEALSSVASERVRNEVRLAVARLVEEERYCADILVQISSAQEALRSVGRALMKNHLRHCASEAIRDTAPGRAEAMYEELLNLMDLHSR